MSCRHVSVPVPVCFAVKKLKMEFWRAAFLHNTMSSLLMSQLSPRNYCWSAVLKYEAFRITDVTLLN